MDGKFCIGVVESKDDPEKRGRIKVRLLGIHPPAGVMKQNEGIGMSTEDLPWAMPTLPLTYGGTSIGTCPPPAVMPGAWVLCLSLDGDVYSNILVLCIISVTLSPLALNNGNGDASLANGFPEKEYNDDLTCMENYYNTIESIESGGIGQKAVSKKGAIGVMQLMPETVAHAIQVTKKKFPEKYKAFVESSGIEIGNGNEIQMATKNEAFNRMIGRGYYSWLLDQCNGDPILAAASYNAGLGRVVKGSTKYGIVSYISKYGDPRKGELTYAEFAERIKAEGNEETAEYITKFLAKMGEDGMKRCSEASQPTTTDPVTGEEVPVTTSGTVRLPTGSNVITSRYGNRGDMSNNKGGGSSNHKGIDLRAPMNTQVYAMMDGIVTRADNQINYGEITIEHADGLVTRYLHNNRANVVKGQSVHAGDTIAYAGGRGPTSSGSKANKYDSHLHFEVLKNGSNIDPEKFLNENGVMTELKKGVS